MTGRRRLSNSDGRPCRTRRALTETQAAVEPGLEAYVERIVLSAPPFTASQRARIAAILNGAVPANCTNRIVADHGGDRA